MPVACRSWSLRHLLLTFRHPVTVRFRRRATGERRVLRLEAVLEIVQIHRLVLQGAPQPFDEHVVQTPTATSIEQRIPAVSNNPVNAILVNWLP